MIPVRPTANSPEVFSYIYILQNATGPRATPVRFEWNVGKGAGPEICSWQFSGVLRNTPNMEMVVHTVRLQGWVQGMVMAAHGLPIRLFARLRCEGGITIPQPKTTK